MMNNENVEQLIQRRKEYGSDFLVIAPTYNEIENIGDLITRLINDVSVAIEILIVDDNSPDGTAAFVEKQKKMIPNLHLLRRPCKSGLGSAYLDGFKIGMNAGFKYVVTMDADLSHDPKVIDTMAEEIKTHDLVIGSRFVRGGGMVDLEVLRIINSKFANLITDKLLGMPFHDCTSGFRCYRVSLLNDNNLEMIIKARRYVFLVELLHFLFKKGYSIKEIPIIFINRLKGETKINISEMIYAAKIILRLIIRSMYTKFMK